MNYGESLSAGDLVFVVDWGGNDSGADDWKIVVDTVSADDGGSSLYVRLKGKQNAAIRWDLFRTEADAREFVMKRARDARAEEVSSHAQAMATWDAILARGVPVTHTPRPAANAEERLRDENAALRKRLEAFERGEPA